MEAAQGPLALPVVLACFVALAFLGVPQFALIAAAVAAFGPARGMAYSWIATLASALIGFSLGRRWGGRLLPASGEGVVGRFMSLVARNGFLASFAIRLAPFAPFVVVNLAAGMTRISLGAFAAGTALGIIPKIILTGVAGASLVDGLKGRAGAWALAALLAAAGAWLVASLIARRWTKS